MGAIEDTRRPIDRASTRDAVRDWMSAVAARDLTDDVRILDDGILTSLQTLQLVLFLEERFGVSVKDDELVEDNFQSINAIVDMVLRKAG